MWGSRDHTPNTAAVLTGTDRVLGSELRLEMRLAPKDEVLFDLTVACESAEHSAPTAQFDTAATAIPLNRLKNQDCEIYTSNEQFNDWVKRSSSDLHMMISQPPMACILMPVCPGLAPCSVATASLRRSNVCG